MSTSVGTFQPNTLQWSVQTKQTVDNTASNTKHFTCTGFKVVHLHADQEFLINFDFNQLTYDYEDYKEEDNG